MRHTEKSDSLKALFCGFYSLEWFSLPNSFTAHNTLGWFLTGKQVWTPARAACHLLQSLWRAAELVTSIAKTIGDPESHPCLQRASEVEFNLHTGVDPMVWTTLGVTRFVSLPHRPQEAVCSGIKLCLCWHRSTCFCLVSACYKTFWSYNFPLLLISLRFYINTQWRKLHFQALVRDTWSFHYSYY